MNLIVKNDALNTLVDDFFTKDLFDWSGRNFATIGTTLPSVNIKETQKDIKFELAAPGLKKEEFNIEVHNNVLSISSEHREEKEEKGDKGKFMRKEFSYKSFSRTFNLPENANADKVDATYKDGILQVIVGKRQTSTPKSSKTILVK